MADAQSDNLLTKLRIEPDLFCFGRPRHLCNVTFSSLNMSESIGYNIDK
jgi:hypothetical protein